MPLQKQKIQKKNTKVGYIGQELEGQTLIIMVNAL